MGRVQIGPVFFETDERVRSKVDVHTCAIQGPLASTGTRDRETKLKTTYQNTFARVRARNTMTPDMPRWWHTPLKD